MKRLKDIESFLLEKAKVQELRAQNQSINSIAKQLNKSVGWVMQRCYECCEPKSIDRQKFFEVDVVRSETKCKTENEFIIYGVMPELKKRGLNYTGRKFHSMDWRSYNKYRDVRPEIDLVYEKGDMTYIIIVKMKVSVSKIYQALGQAITVQYAHSKWHKIEYWIVFPKEIKGYKIFESDFLHWLEKNIRIKIHFF